MKSQPPDLTQFKSLARQIAEQAFKHDKELLQTVAVSELANRKTALDTYQEAVQELTVLIANLQLDVEIETLYTNQENN
jgi:hypothetical protein